MPVVAALMGLSLVVRTWLQAGTDISITFNSADGLEVGKTRLRYKDVSIGTVKSIGFNEDRSKVVVTAELAKEVSDLARDGTNFWVVKPRLDVSGVSGLGTLLSGAYIGVDAIEAGQGQQGHQADVRRAGDRPPSRTTGPASVSSSRRITWARWMSVRRSTTAVSTSAGSSGTSSTRAVIR